MPISLSDHFTYKRLLRFTFPSMIMMIFTSAYGVVDGVFVSNFVGKTSFAAINLIMPVCMLLGALGFMIGTGGSALVSKVFGAGDKRKANEIFSLLIYVSVILGIAMTAIGIIFIRPIAVALGAQGDMLEYCVRYGRILSVGLVPFILQNEFQSFLVAAEKPKLGLYVTVVAGVTNIVLDALFVALFNWGLEGAAWATVISQMVGGLFPFVYFIFSENSYLRLGKTHFYLREILITFANGSSEMMTNLSLSFVNIVYNFQLMRFVGEDGIAAYGVIMYVNFIFISTFIGYSIGSAPIISFHYGANNPDELKNLRKKSNVIIIALSFLMLFLSIALAKPLTGIFVGYDEGLYLLTLRAFTIYSISFLFVGYNIFVSAFFTALNNGLVSAIVSFVRILLFQIIAVLLLPLALGVDGVWLAVVAAEASAMLMDALFVLALRKKYNY